MKSPIKYILLLFVVLPLGPAGADEGGDGPDDGEEESTKTFDIGFDSVLETRNISGSVSYDVPLTENIDFSTSTSLANGFKPEDNSISRSRGTNLSIVYDPPSPWRLDVGYVNSYSLQHRPPSELYDEFKTESSTNSVNSTLNYDFSDDLKTDMNLSVEDTSQEVIITETEVPPPTVGSTYKFGGSVNYDLTAATSTTARYFGQIDKSRIDVAKTKTFPPQPPKPAHSRKIGNTIEGTIDTNKDLNDDFNLHVSFHVWDSVSRDRLQPGLNKDEFRGDAVSDVTYKVSSLLSLTNTINFGRGLSEYHNKEIYRREFNNDIYDVGDTNFSEVANIRVTPGDHAEMNIAVTFSESEHLLRDEGGNLPPRTDPEAAHACSTLEEYKVTSDFDFTLGQDITFHLAHYLTESRPHKIVFPGQDKITRYNNLIGNTGFEWTDNLRVNVDTAMNVTLYRHKYWIFAIDGDRNDLSVNLATGFIYDLTRDTTLEIKTDISNSGSRFVNPSTGQSDTALINRHFHASGSREFGDLFKPAITLDLTYGRSYFARTPDLNKRFWTLGVSPRADVKTSEKLTISTGFTFSNSTEEPANSLRPEDWILRRGYTGSVNVTYVVSNNITFTFSADNSHSVTIRDRRRPYKEIPDESYFDVTANANFVF